MAEIQIRVTPEALQAKAGEVSDSVDRIRKQWSKISETVKNSKTYWEGDASTEHQKKHKDAAEKVDHIIKRLGEHPTDLLSMAGIYTEAEKTASAVSGTLPNDIL